MHHSVNKITHGFAFKPSLPPCYSSPPFFFFSLFFISHKAAISLSIYHSYIITTLAASRTHKVFALAKKKTKVVLSLYMACQVGAEISSLIIICSHLNIKIFHSSLHTAVLGFHDCFLNCQEI